MSIIRINQLPDGSGNLSGDDVLLFMDNPSNDGVTKQISLNELIDTIGVVSISGSIGLATSITGIDLHNGGNQTAEVFQFINGDYQSVITGPTPTSGNNSQRIIIQGQRGQGGEGGDVYLWGGDSDINGGDIKIYAGDADSNESGYGGYVNIDAGNGFNQGGNVSINAGNSSEQGGNVSITAGTSPIGSGVVYIRTGGGIKEWQFNNDGAVIFPNNSTVAVGTFDNGTGGSNGISLNCVVGYELNWQGGRLKNTYNNGETLANIICDSAIEFPGSGIDNMEINSSGLIFSDGTIQTSAFAGEASVIKTNAFNETGSSIPKFSVVYINGGHGDNPTINLAVASGEYTSSKTYGITATNIDHMSIGPVVVMGALSGLNTDQFNPTAPTGNVNGVSLWLSPTTPGGVTTTKPSAPNHTVYVGTIVRTHQNEGIVEVRIQNGYELEELHNVKINSIQNNDVLVYNSGTSLWENNNKAVFSNTVGISGAIAVSNLVKISQTDYNNLSSIDPNTLYVIV